MLVVVDVCGVIAFGWTWGEMERVEGVWDGES